MKPYCFDDKRFSALMWVIIEFLTKESINLHTIEIKLMGLQLSALFLAPFSNISETYVIFQSCGIYSSSMVLFRRRAKGLDTRSTNSIKICGCILSSPHDLFKFSFNISFRTSSSVILEIYFSFFIENRHSSIRFFCKNTNKLFLKNIRLFLVVKFCWIFILLTL